MGVGPLPKLTKKQKTTLKSASREAVRATFRELKSFRKRKDWVGKNNRYRNNGSKVADRDNKAKKPVNQLHMRQYIAALAPLHCSDGWAFLGRAAGAHISGDPDAARHLAYYAELRAAMALLASEGIAVLNKIQFVLDEDLSCRKLERGGTHQVAWLALEHWAGLARAASLLSEIVAPAGIPLSEWLSAFGTPTNVRALSSNWFRQWGLDIRRLIEDREARNESSYRPTRLRRRDVASARTAAESLVDWWSTIEPQADSRFELLDRSP